ncbi:MAG: UDP-N-acetylglucosamine 1-carboxyvinyltransferase [Ruminococcaceae bacterium]|nr:UDP-N-acetylglucosamine 1-carboxyvinyltransferase [Oscillospiraceae bacterium]
MEKLFVQGGRRLSGSISISGMKNAALPILFACGLCCEPCTIHNVPDVSDIANTLEILAAMGCEIRHLGPNSVEINGANFRVGTSPDRLVEKIRASSYLMGVELGREGKTRIAYPGGCKFGSARPLNYHTRAFEIMGAEMEVSGQGFYGEAPGGLHEGKIILDMASVGATINIILAATLTPGTTIIGNAAREPHIVALANFLNMCGGKILGAGTSEIRIDGVRKLHGCTYTIIPDMIEAGTYMCAVAGTGGCVTLTDVIPKHLESIISKLSEMGADIEIGEDTLRISSNGVLKGTQITTAIYPGFPTDMQPQFGVLLCVAQGMSTINEKIWDNRFAYLDELVRMGITVSRTSSTAWFPGNQKLFGSSVAATDLRGGAAMVIAGLMADGITEISHPEYIDRGYDNLIGKLQALGAVIERREICTENAASIVKTNS